MEEIKKKIEDSNALFIRLLFSDLNGRLKSVEVPSRRLQDVLDNKIKCDGSSIEGLARIIESDMILCPDKSSFRIIWLSKEPVAIFFCTLLTYTGDKSLNDPRTILSQEIEALREAGFDNFNIGFEPEFYLLNKGEFGDEGGYFDDTSTKCSNVRKEIVKQLIKSGFEVEAGHHEVGPGQQEITFHFTNALHACDEILLLKLIVKDVARQNDLTATFIPKWKEGFPGNGMHVNMSLAKNGCNTFSADGQLSDIAKYFINGVLNHASEICAFTNPTINSYKRLFSGFEAPCFIAYSQNNRSALIRIPATVGHNARAELRMVDPSCNPYLALSLILKAGMSGINQELLIFQDIQSDIYKLNDSEKVLLNIKTLPTSLENALTQAKNSLLIRETLSKDLLDKFFKIKEKEISKYNLHVSELEKKMYGDC